MTAREWLERTFGATDTFVAAETGDFQRYSLPGVNPSRMPSHAVTARTEDFLAWFGPAIDAALASGGSVYAALTDGTVQDRGWRPYFELWKAKGIIS